MFTPIRLALTALSVFVLSGALATAAPSNGETTYRLAGAEISTTPATFVGVVQGGGTWGAVISHGTLNKAENAATPFTGSFVIRPRQESSITGNVTSGSLIAEAPQFRLLTCTQRFAFSGATFVGGRDGTEVVGVAAGTLTHFGTINRSTTPATCNAFVATATVTVAVQQPPQFPEALALCGSHGGTFGHDSQLVGGSSTYLWTCNNLPSDFPFPSGNDALAFRCFADGGGPFGYDPGRHASTCFNET